MTDQQPRPPLWREMLTVFDQSFDYRDGIARQLRAVADRLVPEESIIESGEGYFRQNEREYLRDILLEEARKAEAGE